MQTLLSEAGRTFLKVFLSSLLIVAPGVLSAPNLNQAVAFGVAALFAAFAMALKAVVVFVPRLSFTKYLPKPYGVYADAFAHSFLATFFVSLTGIFSQIDLSTWKSAVVAALVGAVTVGARAVQGLFTPGETPVPKLGLKVKPLTAPPATPEKA